MNTSLAFLSELELLLELLLLLDPASTASKRYFSSVSSESVSHSSSRTRYWCIDCAGKMLPILFTIKLTKLVAHVLFYSQLCIAGGPYSHHMLNGCLIQCKSIFPNDRASCICIPMGSWHVSDVIMHSKKAAVECIMPASTPGKSGCSRHSWTFASGSFLRVTKMPATSSPNFWSSSAFVNHFLFPRRF